MLEQPASNSSPAKSAPAARETTAKSGSAKTRPAAPRGVNNSTAPINKKDFGFEEARHLLWRAGFGGTAEQVQLLVRWGPEKAVDTLLDFETTPADPVAADTFNKDIMRPVSDEERRMQRQAASARDEETLAKLRLDRQNAEQLDREQMREIQRWWLKRMIESPRPLEEKLTLFWHGHFATSYRTIEDSYHMFRQNQMFRKHAAGNFGQLLFEIIRDPAMLAYLNNNQSRKGRPNENLAREIMELFSLGVGNYSEGDIKEGARALTGYTFKDDDFSFEKNNHDTGVKNILGQSGAMDGDGFVKVILEHPACARFIATKLYRFFIHDFPSGSERLDAAAQPVIRDIESALLSARYDLKPALRRIFLSQHFYDPAVRTEQIKSPVQLVVGAIRSLNTPPRDLSLLADAMNMMGQNIFFPPSVKGWDGGRGWINTSTMFIRQNTLVFLLTGKRPQGRDALADKERLDAQKLLVQLSDAFPGTSSTNSASVLDALLRFTIGRTDPGGRDVLERFMAAHSGQLDQNTMTELLMLITAMPEYQLT
jgi:uncharacterized protein (DUF1800 family)